MPETTTITSTAQLTPAGILGYAKGIAVAVGAILTGVADVVGEDWEYVRWLQLGILICTVIATIAIPNPVEPTYAKAVPPTPAPPAPSA